MRNVDVPLHVFKTLYTQKNYSAETLNTSATHTSTQHASAHAARPQDLKRACLQHCAACMPANAHAPSSNAVEARIPQNMLC